MSDNNEQHQSVESLKATERVSIYCDSDDKLQWTTEADAAGYSSRSEYLYELIQDSRRYRHKGFLSREQKQEEIRRLESEIERLEVKLDNETYQDRALIQTIENPELTKRVLSNRFQPLQEIVEVVLTQSVIAADARGPVERALYQLAQRDLVEYRRGHGWRLTEGR